MKIFCFRFDLKTGSIICAAFVLVTRLIGIIGSSIGLGIIHRTGYAGVSSNGTDIFYKDTYLGTTIGGFVMATISSIMLIFAIREGNKCMFFPWIVYMGLEVSAGIVIWILFVVYGNLALRIGAVFLAALLSFDCYMLHCVVSYYHQVPSQNIGPTPSRGVTQGYVVMPTQNTEAVRPVYPTQSTAGANVIYQTTTNHPQTGFQTATMQPAYPTTYPQQPQSPPNGQASAQQTAYPTIYQQQPQSQPNEILNIK